MSGSAAVRTRASCRRRGSAISEPRTNQLFVTDTPAKLEEVRRCSPTLDVPVRQVHDRGPHRRGTRYLWAFAGCAFGRRGCAPNRGGDGGFNIGGCNRATWALMSATGPSSSGFGGPVNVGGNFVNLPATLFQRVRLWVGRVV